MNQKELSPKNKKPLSSLEKYFKEVRKEKRITAQEEKVLGQRIQAGDEKALHKLVRANLRFVIKTAKKYRWMGLNFDELISEGNVGLIIAAQKFDPAKGVKFVTYAGHWIKQSILKAIEKNGKLIRLPAEKVQTSWKLKKILARLIKELKRKPTDEEIAEAAGIPVDEVNMLLQVIIPLARLDSPLRNGKSEENGTPLYNVVANKDCVNPEEELMQQYRREEISEIVGSLPDKEAFVLKCHFGLGKIRPLPLEEIANNLHISEKRVVYLKDRGLKMLRRSSKGRLRKAC